MTKVSEVMTGHAKWAVSTDTLVEVARKMRDWQLRLLPIRSEDHRFAGVVTDRDIVVDYVASGTDPARVRVSALPQGRTMTVSADDSLEHALGLMIEHGVRQLPVVDRDSLVGMITQADIGRSLTPSEAGAVVDRVSHVARRR